MSPIHHTEGLGAVKWIQHDFSTIGIVILLAFVEVSDTMEIPTTRERADYLLKSRFADLNEVIVKLERVMEGDLVVAPWRVKELFETQRRHDPLALLSDREREVLALMAEGRSNGGIARALWVTEQTVQKHVKHILAKLHLPPSADDHRRILAVLIWLKAR
jgi:DNA-binding NarL/FixJ family response regulator